MIVALGLPRYQDTFSPRLSAAVPPESGKEPIQGAAMKVMEAGTSIHMGAAQYWALRMDTNFDRFCAQQDKSRFDLKSLEEKVDSEGASFSSPHSKWCFLHRYSHLRAYLSALENAPISTRVSRCFARVVSLLRCRHAALHACSCQMVHGPLIRLDRDVQATRRCTRAACSRAMRVSYRRHCRASSARASLQLTAQAFGGAIFMTAHTPPHLRPARAPRRASASAANAGWCRYVSFGLYFYLNTAPSLASSGCHCV